MDPAKFKTVELRAKLNALGLNRKGPKKVLVTRLKYALNALKNPSILVNSMKNEEETATLQCISQATKQSSFRQSSSPIPEDFPDAVKDESEDFPYAVKVEPEDISEAFEVKSERNKIEQQNYLKPNLDDKQNNWYNAFDKMGQPSIDIKEEILCEEFIEGAHEQRSGELFSENTMPKTVVRERKKKLSVKRPAKTSAERTRKYRERKKALKIAANQELNNSIPKTRPKTSTERGREYRSRKRARQNKIMLISRNKLK